MEEEDAANINADEPAGISEKAVAKDLRQAKGQCAGPWTRRRTRYMNKEANAPGI